MRYRRFSIRPEKSKKYFYFFIFLRRAEGSQENTSTRVLIGLTQSGDKCR